MSCEARGLELDMFMAKNLVAIEGYIMSGYGNGWTHCDIICANLPKSSIYEHFPRVSIDIENLTTIDMGATVSSSHCLLAMYEVESLQNLIFSNGIWKESYQAQEVSAGYKNGL